MKKTTMQPKRKKVEPWPVVSLRVPEEWQERLKRLAEKRGHRFTAYMRELIKRGMDEDEKR
jgi:predicted DNA-binding protein